MLWLSHGKELIMKAAVTLTSSESKRLIAKAVVSLNEVKKAMKNAYLLLSDGTTNAFVAQELLGDKKIEAGKCTIGISTNGLLCVNNVRNRESYANVFYKGIPLQGKSFAEALADYHPDTVIIKGANAIDVNGNVGIITTGFDGGSIPRIIGPATSKGLTIITPVGLEKLIPSVSEAAKAFNGSKNIDISMGASGGMFCLTNTTIITEIEAAKILFQVEAVLIAKGGVGGNEGSVTLILEGKEEQVREMVNFLDKSVKGEPPVTGIRGDCEFCRYHDCLYCGKKENELPSWMQTK